MSIEQPPRRAPLSRRNVLKGVGAGAFAAASLGVLPLFSTPDRKQDPAKCTTADLSASERELIVSNWPLYIDPNNKKGTSTRQLFTEKYGIKVDYTADVNDNNEFFAKVNNQLGSCQTTKRDLFVLTDWMAARMIKMGWIQKLDPAKVPNLHANLIDSLHVDWDPNREYSAPWQSGLTGIAYNKKYLPGGVKSFKELLTNPKYKGKMTLLSELRDTMGLIMLTEGIDPAKFTDAQWGQAMGVLEKATQDGQVRRYTGNDYVADLSSGNVLACEAWSGDIANAGDDNLVFVQPEEGVMIWADNMLIPNLAAHKENAEDWINFYYDPVVAATLADFNFYICPVKGAQQAMEKIDPSAVHNELIFPTEKTLARSHTFMALDEFQIREYQGAFSDVTGV
ncbi:MAG TPA: spermidine/putrescine ABC transporter substrate-binding protein [Nocardioides sp.]|nr:spermidine/putrescine ABC transporter substrate-binding protein [Nocardioides sp.]